ncbi:MAG: NAD(P)H-dependent oxidoreductase [Elusimicrobiota bacterium]|jgi:chromate reductase|nr:NAD(P)H-dependent oxidoreductase [Elusimicrobiota bacterium]
MNLLTLIGGISKNSASKRLFEVAKNTADSDFTFNVFDISKLPYFSQDIEDNPPQTVKELKMSIEKSDAVLFVTPEYNRNIPGVLKNAVDWASRPYGRGQWIGKPAAVIGATISPLGALSAQMQLRSLLSFLGMFVMYHPDMYFSLKDNIGADGKLSEHTRKAFENFFCEFKKWILKNK